jgi:hypothetical protein
MIGIVSNLAAPFAELRAAEDRAAELVAGLSDNQTNWRPESGTSWSVRQCLDHLARTNRTYAADLHDAVESCPKKQRTPTGDISPGWVGSWFVRQLEPPVRRKLKTSAELTPPETGDIREAIRAFVESHELVGAILASAAHVDLNRLRSRNPFVSVLRFSVGTGLLIINAHDSRHLWQAERVKEAAGFPEF